MVSFAFHGERVGTDLQSHQEGGAWCSHCGSTRLSRHQHREAIKQADEQQQGQIEQPARVWRCARFLGENNVKAVQIKTGPEPKGWILSKANDPTGWGKLPPPQFHEETVMNGAEKRRGRLTEDGNAPPPSRGRHSHPRFQEKKERHFKWIQRRTPSKMSSGKNFPHTDEPSSDS